MNKSSSNASRWRIEFAKEIVSECYAPKPGILMAVLGGSPTHGLADAYSDLDTVVYWDEVGVGWLEAAPLRDIECERADLIRMGEEDIHLESYCFGGALKVDVAHLSLDFWETSTAGVHDGRETAAWPACPSSPRMLAPDSWPRSRTTARRPTHACKGGCRTAAPCGK